MSLTFVCWGIYDSNTSAFQFWLESLMDSKLFSFLRKWCPFYIFSYIISTVKQNFQFICSNDIKKSLIAFWAKFAWVLITSIWITVGKRILLLRSGDSLFDRKEVLSKNSPDVFLPFRKPDPIFYLLLLYHLWEMKLNLNHQIRKLEANNK